MHEPADRPKRPDDEETPYCPTFTWALYLLYERHTATGVRPHDRRMMQRYLCITCFGCGGDLDVPPLHFGPTRLCPECLADRLWERN
jgi:hypothetical protein